MPKHKLSQPCETAKCRVLPCMCQNAFQDTKFGHGMRLHNACTKDPDTVRCTVCGSLRSKHRVAAVQQQTAARKTMGAKKAGLKASGKQGQKKKSR